MSSPKLYHTKKVRIIRPGVKTILERDAWKAPRVNYALYADRTMRVKLAAKANPSPGTFLVDRDSLRYSPCLINSIVAALSSPAGSPRWRQPESSVPTTPCASE